MDWKTAPSYSSIRRAICTTHSSSLEAIFREDANERESNFSYAVELQVLSFDGKALRGSFDDYNDVKLIQILSIFSKKSKLILAHEVIEEKTNEIPIAQALIPRLNFKNAVFTADALSCQKKTANIIVASGNDFVVQVKENQNALLDACKLSAETSLLKDTYLEPIEKEHGRITFRKASVFKAEPHLMPNDGWCAISNIIMIERFRELFNTKTNTYKSTPEISYYVATNNLNAEEYNKIIRGHWGIENSNHYVRDVSLKEDASRIRINPQNMVLLRSFSLNILREGKVKNIALRMYENSVKIKNLFKLNVW